MSDKQHFLPATYLGGFSASHSLPRRDRPIFVGDKQTGNVFPSKAGNVAVIKNLYTLIEAKTGFVGRSGQNFIDKVWSEYESDLADAIRKLIAKQLDAKTWIRTLVPFVACLFLRGPDFIERFNSRFSPDLDAYLTKDNANRARLFELQRLLAPVLAAKWIVFRKTGADTIITSDIGFSPFLGKFIPESGISIPLDSNHILALVFKREWNIAIATHGKWIPNIAYHTLNARNHHEFNSSIASLAQRWIYGRDQAVVRKYLKIQTDVTRIPELMEFSELSSRDLRAHELTWHYAASILSKPPRPDKTYTFEIEFEELTSGWSPPIIFSTNFPICPPPFQIANDLFHISFYDPEAYYSEVDAKTAMLAKDYQEVIRCTTDALNKAFEARQIIRLHIMRGKAFNLLEEYENAISDFNTSQELLTAENKNNNVEILLNRARAFMALNKYSSAWRDYNNLKIDELENDTLKASVHFGRGICHLELKNGRDLALTELSKAIALDKEFFEAYMIQAKLFSDQNDHQKAVEVLSAALNISVGDEELAQVHNLRGICLNNLGKIEESISDFTKAIKYKTSDCDYHFNRGLNYFNKGNFKAAMQDFDEAIKINPQYAEAYNAKGGVYLHQGAHTQAIENFTEAIKYWGKNKERVRAIRNTILCLIELKQLSKAQELLTEVLTLDPHHPFSEYVKLRLMAARSNS